MARGCDRVAQEPGGHFGQLADTAALLEEQGGRSIWRRKARMAAPLSMAGTPAMRFALLVAAYSDGTGERYITDYDSATCRDRLSGNSGSGGKSAIAGEE